MDFNDSCCFNVTSLLMLEVTPGTNASVSRNKSVANAYEWRFVLAPYIIIFLLSVSGNGLVIATLASNRRMRTVTNVYLLNLAISDFSLGFGLPFTLIGQMFQRFLFGATLCKFIPFLQAVSVSVDVWTLVAISLERYFAICRPLESRKWQTQCHAYKMIATVWVLSLCLNSPILLVSTLLPTKGNAYKCREVWSSLEVERTFNLGLDAALLLIPFFIMSVAYSLIVTKLWRGLQHEIQHNYNWQKQLHREDHISPTTPILNGNANALSCKNGCFVKKNKEEARLDFEFRHVVRSTHIDKSIEAKRKVIRMLFVIILEFFVCWTPLHVINTIYLFYPIQLYEYIGSKGIASFQLLAHCSSCCNPITYCFMNRKFRQSFISLFKSSSVFRCCFPVKLVEKQATPQPSSQDVTACIIRGSHTGRTDMDGQEVEDCV